MKQSSLSGDISGITSMAVEDSSVLWSPELSDSLYNIHGWGDPYFSVNSYGNMCAHPNGKENTLHKEEIDLLQVVKKVTCCCSSGGLGLQPPLLIRLPEVLRNRLESLQSAFDLAIMSRGYESHYQGVYPVKCNQDRSVVEDIVRFGIPFRFGLEAGSKPELLLTMSCLCKAHPDSFLICNGFKDKEYVSLALMARKLSLNSVIVLEQEEELPLVIHLGRSLGIRPVIGVRAKLRTKHCGHFGGTSGEKGKFGLSTAQILRVLKKLEEEDMLDCLQLLHFHVGSQIPCTDIVREGISEAAQIYCELVRLGANMRVIDVGGGLGIDYDGSHSGESDLSVAYNLEEYAMAVVRTVQFICDGKSVSHPVICSESGRAIVSHHSVLIFNASSSSSSSSSSSIPPPQSSSPSINHADLQQLLEGVTEADSNGDLREEYTAYAMNEKLMKQRCLQQFKEGSLTLEQVAAVDSLCEFAARVCGGGEEAVRTYNVNLSVFTSIPDFWSIGQLYPIVPVHRLDERPMVRGILSDLTCDSDGKIDKFINGERTLLLHEEEEDKESYYLGLFLGGAYEEALGGLHNLFGGVSVVRVVSSGDCQNGFCVTVGTQGRTCADVLGAMQHEPGVMFQTLKHRAVEVGGMVGMDPIALVLFFGRMFDSMPYLSLPSSSSSCAMVCSGCCYYEGEEEEEGCRGVTGDAAAASEDDVWTAYCCA